MSELYEILQKVLADQPMQIRARLHTCMVSNYMTCAFVQIEWAFFGDSAEH